MSVPKPRPTPPSTTRRDLVISLLCGAGVLVAIALGIMSLNKERQAPTTNQLTGTIVEKRFSGQKETDISFGTRGLHESIADSGFSFMVRVKSENRVYEVPVSRAIYQSKKVGDEQTFIRPPSEQR